MPTWSKPGTEDPERHDRAKVADLALLRTIPALGRAAGGHMIASVSVRHDPIDAVEDVLVSDPIEELLFGLTPHLVVVRLHRDLARRLAHHGLPITTVGEIQ